MKTTYTIYHTDGNRVAASVDWPEEPGFHRIRQLVQPIVGFPSGEIEHVTVLHPEDGRIADMFVHETGHLIGLQHNAEATAIYQANYLKRYPLIEARTLPTIVGRAVLFDRIVWV